MTTGRTVVEIGVYLAAVVPVSDGVVTMGRAVVVMAAKVLYLTPTMDGTVTTGRTDTDTEE